MHVSHFTKTTRRLEANSGQKTPRRLLGGCLIGTRHQHLSLVQLSSWKILSFCHTLIPERTVQNGKYPCSRSDCSQLTRISRQSNTLRPYLNAVRSTLTAALTLENFSSQVVERHNLPEIEAQYARLLSSSLKLVTDPPSAEHPSRSS